jgi:hypothetical protein
MPFLELFFLCHRSIFGENKKISKFDFVAFHSIEVEILRERLNFISSGVFSIYVHLNNVQLQNVQIPNVQLPDIQLQNVQDTNRPGYQTYFLQNVQVTKRPV